MTAPAIRLGSGRATALVVVGEAATTMAMAVAALAATAVLADETGRRRRRPGRPVPGRSRRRGNSVALTVGRQKTRLRGPGYTNPRYPTRPKDIQPRDLEINACLRSAPELQR